MTREPVVRLADGAVRGTTVAGVSAFLGIPYAAAPFGANRMRAPQPVAPWDGEREATAFGPTVPKGDYPPLGWRGEQVGDLVVDRFVGEPLSGRRDGRGRHVEGGDLAAEIGQEGGVAADAAADHEGAPAGSGDALSGGGLGPLGEVQVGLAVVPGHDGLAVAGFRVQGLEPASRVAGRGRPGGELAGTAAH